MSKFAITYDIVEWTDADDFAQYISSDPQVLKVAPTLKEIRDFERDFLSFVENDDTDTSSLLVSIERQMEAVATSIERSLGELERLRDENQKLRRAAQLIAKRQYMTSGSEEMAECDEFCKELGLKPWNARWCGLLAGEDSDE